jgi:hypothetical protein
MTTKILGDQITAYTINTEQFSNTATAAFAKTLAPKILYANVASNTYSVLDDTAVNVGGGFIVITGAEFQSGATVLIDTVAASAVTYVNSTTLRAQVPAKSAASYNLYVVNPDGGTGLKVAGITYSGFPTWVTTSPLSTQFANEAFNTTFNATGATSYSVTEGSTLPPGTTLAANGYFSGTVTANTSTTYNFNITATDNELQNSTNAFSLDVFSGYTIQYLLIGGGGGGGTGGGGAGGFLSGNTMVGSGTSYTITVGSGGAGVYNNGFSSPSPIGTGNNSTIIGSGLSSLTAYGGGTGGSPIAAGGGGTSPLNSGTQIGGTGGSGGGSGGNSAIGNQVVNGGLAIGSPAAGVVGTQGYPGGSCGGAGGSPGGGGGGAGSAGGPGPGPMAGGTGSVWPLTGSTYAGGGGSGSYSVGGGAGGSGGGGAGNAGPAAATPGTTNTGGGGGGQSAFGQSGSGGSGVVILAVPTPKYPGSAPGATVTTPPAAPGQTVLTFNSSGTYIA